MLEEDVVYMKTRNPEKSQERLAELFTPRNLTTGTWSHDGFQVRNLQKSRDFFSGEPC